MANGQLGHSTVKRDARRPRIPRHALKDNFFVVQINLHIPPRPRWKTMAGIENWKLDKFTPSLSH